MWVAFTTFALYLVYIADLLAGGVASGVPREPFLTLAELLTMLAVILQVALFAIIHAAAPPSARPFSLVALGFMFVMAGATLSVHFVQLTVGRHIHLTELPTLRFVFGWVWPSLLYGVELAAWHLFFGLALIAAAPAINGKDLFAGVRIGFLVAGLLCLVGIVGPASGHLQWRAIGVVGYAAVFPLCCLLLGLAFRRGLASSSVGAEAASRKP